MARWLLRPATLWPAVAAVLLLSARADIRIFRIDSASSSLQSEGGFAGIPLVAQGAEGLAANYEGRLVCDVGTATLSLLPGSYLRAQAARVWEPGTAPASYGAKGSKGSGFELASTTLALRSLGFLPASEPLSVGSNGEVTGEIRLPVDPASHPEVDYVWHQLVSRAGSLPLAGAVTNGAATAPTLGFALEVQRLTLPVDVTVTATFATPEDCQFHLTGTMVGTFGLTLLDPELIWIPGVAEGDAFTLVWNTGGTLQRTTQLGTTGWSDVSAQPPVVIPAAAAVEFFRVVFR